MNGKLPVNLKIDSCNFTGWLLQSAYNILLNVKIKMYKGYTNFKYLCLKAVANFYGKVIWSGNKCPQRCVHIGPLLQLATVISWDDSSNRLHIRIGTLKNISDLRAQSHTYKVSIPNGGAHSCLFLQIPQIILRKRAQHSCLLYEIKIRENKHWDICLFSPF